MPTHEGRTECRFLEAAIAQVQSALARRGAMRAGFWAAAAVMVAMAGLLAVDGATDFAAGSRAMVYAVALAAWAAAVGAATLAGGARILPPECVARLIEQVRPDLKNALVTFVEMRSDPSADPWKTAAVARRAARVLADADLGEFVPTACVRRATWAAMGGACLMAVTLWLVQGVLFGGGPAPAKAGMMGGVSPLTAPISTQADPPATGAKPASASPQEKPRAEAPAQPLAAALEADKEKLEKLARALGEKPGGAGQGAGKGGSGSGAGGQAPSEGDVDRAPSGSSGVRLNEENRVSPGGSAAGQPPSAGDVGQAPSAGQTPGAGDASTPEGQPNVGPGGSPGAGEGSPKVPAGRSSAPPLPKRPQSDAFPEKTLDAMRKVRRMIDEADKRLREGEVTDGFLSRMGMSNAEFRRFVAGWQRQIEASAAETSAVPAATRLLPGGPTPKLEFSPGGGGTDARPIGGLAPEASAIQGGAVQGADTSVSTRLRPAVSAYFERVGKLAAENAEARATP